MAAPALALAEGGALDTEAASRGIALALPDRDIPMLPPAIQHLIALNADEFRPAVIVDIYLDGNLKVRRMKLRLRRVRAICLPVADVGTPTGLRSRLHNMANLAHRLRQQRLAAGALFLPRQPRLEVRQGQLLAVGEPDTAVLITEEFGILISTAVGEKCAREGIPAIFETRDAPPLPTDVERTESAGRLVSDVVEAHALQRGLRRPRLQVEPAANTMLGVSACATVTAPMRRYTDLVMQRQLVHLCTRRVAGYAADDLERVLTDTTAARDAAARVEGSSRRYWSVKYLEQRVGATLVATVLERAGLGYVVLLDDCGLKTYVPVDRELTAQPGDRLSIHVDQASARRDFIRLRVKS